MTDRVLRWLSAVSLALSLLLAVWFVTELAHRPNPILGTLSPVAGTIYLLALLLFPAAVGGICLVAGVATLVVSAQHRQWGWFTAALVCLAVFFYGNVATLFPAFRVLLFADLGRAYTLSADYALFDYVLVRVPLVAVTLIYAWTRRGTSPASATA
jgi:hypothetical protein